MDFDSYIIVLNIDDEEKYVYKGYATVSSLELAKHFNGRKTAKRYLNKYKYGGLSPRIIKILGKEEYKEFY